MFHENEVLKIENDMICIKTLDESDKVTNMENENESNSKVIAPHWPTIQEILLTSYESGLLCDVKVIASDGYLLVNRILVILLYAEFLKNFDEDLEIVLLPDATVKDLKENLYLALSCGEELVEEVAEILEDYNRDDEDEIKDKYEVKDKNSNFCDDKLKTEYDSHLPNSKLHSNVNVKKGSDKVFKSHLDEENHGKSLLVEFSPPVTCQKCRKEMCKALELKEHKCLYANYNPTKCSSCGKILVNRLQMISHLCLQIEKSNTKSNVLRNNTDENRKSFSCSVCEKSFQSKSSLRDHLTSHTGERKFHCIFCPAKLKTKNNLQTHIASCHGDKDNSIAKDFNCAFCPKRFRFQAQLNQHVRSHTNEKPYKCQICGKGFSAKCNLKAHHEVHREEKSFKCDECGHRVTSKVLLKLHYLTHTGERPFVCNLCGEAYKRPHNLRRHKKSCNGQKPSYNTVNAISLSSIKNPPPHNKKITHNKKEVADSHGERISNQKYEVMETLETVVVQNADEGSIVVHTEDTATNYEEVQIEHEEEIVLEDGIAYDETPLAIA